MSGDWICPVCVETTIASHTAITVHTGGARHRLRALGLNAEEAEQIAQMCYKAGISHEAAMAALRDAMSRPPGEYARMAAALRGLGSAIGSR